MQAAHVAVEGDRALDDVPLLRGGRAAVSYVVKNGLEFLVCPECGWICDAEYVDIGVGNQRIEPWHCPECGWIEETVDIDLDDGFPPSFDR